MVGVVRMGRKKSRGGDASPSQIGSLIEFGREVRRRREAAGLTLEDLAESSGLSPNYIGQIETGKRDPSLATMESLAQALDVPLGDLIGGVRAIGPVAIEVARMFDQLSAGMREGLLMILRDTATLMSTEAMP